jgi:GMP synthase (glutamine-hydrolysing)
MSAQILAVRHVAFEDLGVFAPVLTARGLQIRYLEAGVDDLTAVDPLAPDLLVLLGGPIGAYEEDAYPYVLDEVRIAAARLAAGKPILGVCLGAQVMARALGARVYPGPAKEIGWAPLTLTDAGRAGPLGALEGAAALHWHGDTFDLPAGAERLASTDLTPNQAFTVGRHALALQFHLEADPAGFERWLIGHACEISHVPGLTPAGLRADAKAHGAKTAAAGAACLTAWLDQAGI